jgi:hypothetical protein
LAALLALAPAGLAAQTGSELRLAFQELEGTQDSAYSVPAGASFSVTVAAQYYAYPGVAAFTIRIWFDPALLTFVSARSSCPDSTTYPLNPPVTGANYVELSATGCASFYSQHNVATVQFRLANGATTGTGLYLEPRALVDRNAVDRTADATGDFDEVCLAVGIWGDVDADGLVNSRDALIALSNAVGLPTPGFVISRGDVDGDGYVGSRDALGMLSASIGYPPAYGFRTGRGIATACAPQPVLPRTLYFVRQGTPPGIAGVSGLVVRAANDSAQTIVGDSADAQPYYPNSPRVSPDGSKLVFGCLWNLPSYGRYFNICRANADGSGLVSLTTGSFSTDYGPDWSPAGDSIVFVRNNQIWVMAADGSNQHAVPSSPSVYAVAWAPTAGSRRVAYANTAYPGEVRTRDIDNATTDSLVFAGSSYSYYPRFVDWSPAGDSLVFSLVVNGYSDGTFVTPRAGGAAVRIARLSGYYGPETGPAWTDQGTFFNVYQDYPGPARPRLFLVRPNGTIVRIGRDPTGNVAAGMDKQ